MKRVIGLALILLVATAWNGEAGMKTYRSAGTIVYPAQNEMQQQVQELIPVSQVVIAEADTEVTGTAFADITGLSFTLEGKAGQIYWIEADILYTTSATSAGINLGVNGPSSGDVAFQWSALTAADTQVQRSIVAYDTATTAPTSLAGYNYAKLSGFYVGSAFSGTFALRVAADAGANTVTVKAGSRMTYSLVVDDELRYQK